MLDYFYNNPLSIWLQNQMQPSTVPNPGASNFGPNIPSLMQSKYLDPDISLSRAKGIGDMSRIERDWQQLEQQLNKSNTASIQAIQNRLESLK